LEKIDTMQLDFKWTFIFLQYKKFSTVDREFVLFLYLFCDDERFACGHPNLVSLSWH